jgi:hypothetical protein
MRVFVPANRASGLAQDETEIRSLFKLLGARDEITQRALAKIKHSLPLKTRPRRGPTNARPPLR